MVRCDRYELRPSPTQEAAIRKAARAAEPGQDPLIGALAALVRERCITQRYLGSIRIQLVIAGVLAGPWFVISTMIAEASFQ